MLFFMIYLRNASFIKGQFVKLPFKMLKMIPPTNQFVLFFLFVCSSLYAQTDHYLVKLNYPGFGEIHFYMTFEVNATDSSFIAYTNPESLTNTMSLKDKMLIRMFSKGTKKGAVLQVLKGKISANNHYQGDAVSSLGNYSFYAFKGDKSQLNGRFQNKRMQFDFSAHLVGEPTELDDYSELYQKIEQEFTQQIYNPKVLKRTDWKHFLRNLKRSLAQSKDDLDVIVAFRYHTHKLKTSHVFLTKTNETDAIAELPNVDFKQIDDKTSVITFNRFLLADTAVVNTLMKEMKTPNLVVDLRSCPGGDFSSLLFASHFIKEEQEVGYFLGNKYYQFNNQLPNQNQIGKMPVFTKGTLKDFFMTIDQQGALLGKVKPAKYHYTGKTYVLIGKQTASAAEPLAYFIKKHKIGPLIGENTSGHMLSSKGYPIYKQWNLTIPVANYFTIDQKELDQVGVYPDVHVATNQAMKTALALIQTP